METTPETAVVEQQKPPVQHHSGAKRRRPGRKKKILKNILAILISLSVIGALVYITYYAFYKPPETFYMTQRIEIWEYPITRSVYGYGMLSPVLSETVTLTETGVVQEANVFYNQQVNEGDVLVTLDTSAIDKAVAEHQKTIDGHNKSIADREAMIVKAEEAIVKLYEDLAKANAEQIALAEAARLYAPFDGQIVDAERLVVGTDIPYGMNLGRLIDDSRMTLTLYFSYGYENDIRLGQTCEVSVPSVMSTLTGTVTGIEKVRRVGADGSVSFEVTVTVDNPGALTRESPATATLKTAGGEDILPVGPGTLECAREEILVVESQGPLKVNNMRNFYDVKEGDLLVELDFQPDTTIEDVFMSQIEGQQETIAGHQEAIEGYRAQIIGVEDLIALEYERMENLTLLAPISGTITSYVELFPGTSVGGTGSQPISITIAQTNTVILEGELYQSDVTKVSVGMPVEINYNGMPYTGILTEIKQNPNQQQNPGMGAYFPITISLDNADGGLMVGSGASFDLILETSIDTPIIVPIQAVKGNQQGEFIYLKPRDGLRPETAVDIEPAGVVPEGFYAIPVECGIQDTRYIEIVSGILPEWKGWEVFTQETDTLPSPLPSYDFGVEISDPDMRVKFDEGYAKGYEDGLNASPSPVEGEDPGMEFPGGDFGGDFGSVMPMPAPNGGDEIIGGSFDVSIPDEPVDEEPADEEAVDGEAADGDAESEEEETETADEPADSTDAAVDAAAPEPAPAVVSARARVVRR
ncbi:MAG: HlyD family efflux transporter periplasmic adaptor subunit [Oscillospiraceae bacterium]|jgi:multidrug resistance efflux pump|nr:HlyD family efflux transporter periplasmic adaptor subunit [Oscillospiraceae bacterium]